MPGSLDAADESRWPALIRRSHDPLFVLNRHRRLLFANAAFERLTKSSLAEARGLTFTRRATGHTLAELGRVLSPPEDVVDGRAAAVRRAPPGRGHGPPWWDVDFLPVTDGERLLGVIGRVRYVEGPSSERLPLPVAWGALRAAAVSRFGFAAWDSETPAVRRALTQARLVAETGCPAVILGEPGTGKRHMARTIHAASARRELPFIGLDCARLPASAVRAVLTGPLGLSHPDRAGLIYLNGPSALPLDLQADIAGRSAERPPLIAGFSAEPHEAVRTGKLHCDLLAALGVVVIELPALRERYADWPRLLDQAMRWAVASFGRPPLTLAIEAAAAIREFAWPGNHDELIRTLQSAVSKATGESIGPTDLPRELRLVQADVPRAEELPPLDKLLEQVEGRMIRLALARAKGNKSKAADLLGVWRPRLLRRMVALGITDPEP